MAMNMLCLWTLTLSWILYSLLFSYICNQWMLLSGTALSVSSMIHHGRDGTKDSKYYMLSLCHRLASLHAVNVVTDVTWHSSCRYQYATKWMNNIVLLLDTSQLKSVHSKYHEHWKIYLLLWNLIFAFSYIIFNDIWTFHFLLVTVFQILSPSLVEYVKWQCGFSCWILTHWVKIFASGRGCTIVKGV